MDDTKSVFDTYGTPGSDTAVKNGCSCPILDNGHGRGYLGCGEQFGWVISGLCPLHGSLVGGGLSDDDEEAGVGM